MVRHFLAWIGVVVIGAATMFGCSDNPATTGKGGAGGSGASGGAGAAGGAGGGETGGAGGGTVATPGAPGHTFVNAGNTVKSPGYTMVFSLGQSSPVQTKISSPGYQLNGGLIGATGSPK